MPSSKTSGPGSEASKGFGWMADPPAEGLDIHAPDTVFPVGEPGLENTIPLDPTDGAKENKFPRQTPKTSGTFDNPTFP